MLPRSLTGNSTKISNCIPFIFFHTMNKTIPLITSLLNEFKIYANKTPKNQYKKIWISNCKRCCKIYNIYNTASSFHHSYFPIPSASNFVCKLLQLFSYSLGYCNSNRWFKCVNWYPVRGENLYKKVRKKKEFFSFFLGCFIGREHVFFLFFLFS